VLNSAMAMESVSLLDRIKLLLTGGTKRKRVEHLPLQRPGKNRALLKVQLKVQERAVREVYDEIMERACRRRIRMESKVRIPISKELDEVYKKVTRGTLQGEIVLVERFNVKITVEVAACLKDRTWLNDEVINFYFALLQERNVRQIESGERVPKCVFLNSFFYTKLSEKGYNYDGVRRWTKRKKIDIFEQDVVFFPVNLQNVHWCMGVINLAEKRIEYFDSMNGRSSQFFEVMLDFVLRLKRSEYD
jgi:Ulp1 family protease